ncbi:4'-phosphopantetheinyl transferase family protein [Streptomyces sp. NPDC101169]|uniref:4'-phosphopantetheinyl transferase family protein n=1 Tax=unclassified Streptomyces TaxID=2593676 RepID=UPI0038067666
MAVRVWVVDARTADEAEAARLLSAAELDRAGELDVASVRRTFVLSRALQRTLGSRYSGAPAAEVDITRACAHCAHPGHGKPRFAAAPELDYSVSHSGDLVAIAASTDTRVGLDVEAGSRHVEPERMIPLLATESERTALAGLSGQALRRELFRLWAYKEAVVKLTGHGLLAVPFTALGVDGPVVRLTAPLDHWPGEAIRLTGLSLDEGYVSALATTGPPPEVAVDRLARVTDLAW